MTAPSPTSYLVMLCITLLLPILLALSRHFIKHTRHYTYQPLSKAHLLTEIFYYTAICTHLAMISMLIYRTSTEVRLENHFRTHHPTLPPAIRDERIFQAMTTQKMLLVLFASGCCYYSALCLIKGAFLAFYWGLYTRAGIAHKWIKVAIALTLVLVGSTFLVGLLWCRPIYRNWSSDYEDYVKCTSVNSLAVRIVGTTASVVGDVAIILLPISLLSRLTLGLREKAALGLVYSIGLVSVIACITSLANLVIYFFRNPKSLNGVRSMEMWTIVETTSAIFAFSLPAYKKFILRKIGTRAGDRVRPLEPVNEGAGGGGGDVERGTAGEGGDSATTSGTGRLEKVAAAPRKRGGVGGWFTWFQSSSPRRSPNSSHQQKSRSLPSFVRGSLVGVVGVGSGGGGSALDGSNHNKRRRRTLDDIELSSFDDYEEDRGGNVLSEEEEGASASASASAGSCGTLLIAGGEEEEEGERAGDTAAELNHQGGWDWEVRGAEVGAAGRGT